MSILVKRKGKIIFSDRQVCFTFCRIIFTFIISFLYVVLGFLAFGKVYITPISNLSNLRGLEKKRA